MAHHSHVVCGGAGSCGVGLSGVLYCGALLWTGEHAPQSFQKGLHCGDGQGSVRHGAVQRGSVKHGEAEYRLAWYCSGLGGVV